MFGFIPAARKPKAGVLASLRSFARTRCDAALLLKERLPLGSSLHGHKFCNRRNCSLNYGYIRVKMDRTDCRLKRCWAANLGSLVAVPIILGFGASIEVMRKAINVRREGVENPTDILAKVDAAQSQVRKQLFKRDDLVLGEMATIVDHDIQRWNFLFEPFPKTPIALIANEYPDGVAFIGSTRRLDIDPVDPATRSEIILPHFQAAATVDSYLQNVDFTIPKAAEMSVVNIKVVDPLPDP